MSVQFKFSDTVDDDRRLEIIEALKRAGFAARSLFPGQKRPKLASIFTVAKANAKDIKALRAALTDYGREIEYVEASPDRSLKA
jgi:predicted ribosome quality control (RQC) complex YloA/Tae2 family protein